MVGMHGRLRRCYRKFGHGGTHGLHADGISIGSPWPMMLLLGFRKTTGYRGSGKPVSAACRL